MLKEARVKELISKSEFWWEESCSSCVITSLAGSNLESHLSCKIYLWEETDEVIISSVVTEQRFSYILAMIYLYICVCTHKYIDNICTVDHCMLRRGNTSLICFIPKYRKSVLPYSSPSFWRNWWSRLFSSATRSSPRCRGRVHTRPGSAGRCRLASAGTSHWWCVLPGAPYNSPWKALWGYKNVCFIKVQ